MLDGDVVRNPSMGRWIEEWCIARTLPLKVFTQRNFVADFFRQKLKSTGKIAKSRLCHPLADLGETHTVRLWLVEKRVADFLLVLVELFRQLSRLKRYERISVEIVVFERMWSL